MLWVITALHAGSCVSVSRTAASRNPPADPEAGYGGQLRGRDLVAAEVVVVEGTFSKAYFAKASFFNAGLATFKNAKAAFAKGKFAECVIS